MSGGGGTYVTCLARVAHGDLGRSIRAQHPVRDLIVEKLPATLLLTTTAAVIALLIAFPAGITVGARLPLSRSLSTSPAA